MKISEVHIKDHVDRIHLVHERDRWRILANTFSFHKRPISVITPKVTPYTYALMRETNSKMDLKPEGYRMN